MKIHAETQVVWSDKNIRKSPQLPLLIQLEACRCSSYFWLSWPVASELDHLLEHAVPLVLDQLVSQPVLAIAEMAPLSLGTFPPSLASG